MTAEISKRGTVFVFGAGINADLQDHLGVNPPLARTFFKSFLQHHQARPSYGYVLSQYRPLFQYIEQNWGFTVAELYETDFDLEDCYTKLQEQLCNAQEGEGTGLEELLTVRKQLTGAFRHFLAQFSLMLNTFPSFGVDRQRYKSYLAFSKLGRLVLDSTATVITFNYDTLLERAMEQESGNRWPFEKWSEVKFTDPERGSQFRKNWQPAMAYGFKFDYVGVNYREQNRRFVSQDDYYDNDRKNLYDKFFLKMHGSLNWFRHSGQWEPQGRSTDSIMRAEETVLFSYPETDPYGKDLSIWPSGDILEPMIITPGFKEFPGNPFDQIWEAASGELAGCRKLVVGGYSFPESDSRSRQLFRDAFQDRSPPEIWMIDPDREDRVRKTLETITGGSVIKTDSVKEFIENHAQNVIPGYRFSVDLLEAAEAGADFLASHSLNWGSPVSIVLGDGFWRLSYGRESDRQILVDTTTGVPEFSNDPAAIETSRD